MELCTERLVLKETTWDDVELIHSLHCVKEVEEFNTIGIPRHTGDTLEVMLVALEDQQSVPRTHFAWTVWLRDTRQFVGEAGMHLSADRFRRGEIHYSLFPEYWQNGYATEIVKNIISFGFRELNLHRIEAGVAKDNARSIRVVEKAGMQCEGLRRKSLPIRGEWIDNFQYAILEDDPKDY
ncbi:GNAT family N-acetyltransferase [Arundinibacter roseus]|uniref:N-acetyltransferase n=1 Tax=Arundinibacter roseus TaxID=2070510 RepID=A0A4R4KLY8_9BACT|nr:GNAT family N-acetyltransferase [Arundinibacter roseus]TDB67982.1 N-acetyltransferase [Arundinibacter roseus]